MRWATCAALTVSIGMSAASLFWSARRELGLTLTTRGTRLRAAALDVPSSAPAQAPVPAETGDAGLQGVVEALPQNVYHVTPYNDWPLFAINVREGQRLKFRRENGKWVGDSNSLTIQFETPAEIDSKSEEMEIAALERQSAELAADVLAVELQK